MSYAKPLPSGGGGGGSGASGYSGYSGKSGFSGVSGYSGKSGFSGFSGVSGFSGATGSPGTTDHAALSNLDYASAGHTGFAGLAANSFSDTQTFSIGNTVDNLIIINVDATDNQGAILFNDSAGNSSIGFNFLSIYPALVSTGYLGTQNGSWIFYGAVDCSGGFPSFAGIVYNTNDNTTYTSPDGVTWTAIGSGSGTSGYSGFSGVSGFSGYSGKSGYSGYSGMGTSGFSGYSGTSGVSGFSGYSGASGFSGFSGKSGYSGISGFSGYSGTSGISGFSGKSGYSGISGFSGYSGVGTSGYSGISGFSGYSGVLPALTEAPSNQAFTGISVSMTYGESLVPGDLVYFKSDGKVWKADADAAGLYPCMGMAMETASSGSHVVLLNGIYRDDSRYNFTVGGVVYLSTTAGTETQTQPSATDNVIQVIGIATHADRIYFNPDLSYITHT